MSSRFGLGIRIMSNFFLDFILLASPGMRVISFCSLFRIMFSFADLFASGFNSFE